MFCDASHSFWDDEKKFDKYSTKFAEKQLQRERTLLNLDFSYQPTIPGTKQGTFQSSKYRTFLSELEMGSFLKKDGCTETSQCYELTGILNYIKQKIVSMMKNVVQLNNIVRLTNILKIVMNVSRKFQKVSMTYLTAVKITLNDLDILKQF